MSGHICHKHHPCSDEFDPVATGEHLTKRINQFNKPQALIAYWRQPLNELRLKAMPEKWRTALQRRYQERLDAINDHGPDYLATNESMET